MKFLKTVCNSSTYLPIDQTRSNLVEASRRFRERLDCIMGLLDRDCAAEGYAERYRAAISTVDLKFLESMHE